MKLKNGNKIIIIGNIIITIGVILNKLNNMFSFIILIGVLMIAYHAFKNYVND